MTTPIVPTVTEELVADLESLAGRVTTPMVTIPLSSLMALLAERADLKQQLAAASVDAQMLADVRSVISREWLPRSVGSSAAKDLLIQKMDARLSGAVRAAATD